MVTQQIDSLKQEYTDKYVMVDATRPELARFRDIVGRVKTVNMSGRALVEFDDYLDNIGWYDIDLSFLKVVDKPPPKVEKPVEKKPAAEKKAAAPAKAPAETKAKAAAKPAAAGGKPSVADILAAARAGKAAPGETGEAKTQAEAAPEVKEEPETPAVEKAVEKAPAAAAPAKSAEKVDKSKMTIDDMIAWCREHDSK